MASEPCLASFWRQTNIKISWDLVSLVKMFQWLTVSSLPPPQTLGCLQQHEPREHLGQIQFIWAASFSLSLHLNAIASPPHFYKTISSSFDFFSRQTDSSLVPSLFTVLWCHFPWMALLNCVTSFVLMTWKAPENMHLLFMGNVLMLTPLNYFQLDIMLVVFIMIVTF